MSAPDVAALLLQRAEGWYGVGVRWSDGDVLLRQAAAEIARLREELAHAAGSLSYAARKSTSPNHARLIAADAARARAALDGAPVGDGRAMQLERVS